MGGKTGREGEGGERNHVADTETFLVYWRKFIIGGAAGVGVGGGVVCVPWM